MNKTIAGGLLNAFIENSIKKHNVTAKGNYPEFIIEEEVISLYMDSDYVLSPNDMKYLIFLIEKYEKGIYPSAYIISKDSISLTKNAEPFLMDGGFKKLFENEDREEYFKDQLVAVNNSVISTNKSIKRTNIITIIIASLAVIFSLIALIREFKSMSKVQVQELQETNKLLQKTMLKLDSLPQNFLQKIDSSKK